MRLTADRVKYVPTDKSEERGVLDGAQVDLDDSDVEKSERMSLVKKQEE